MRGVDDGCVLGNMPGIAESSMASRTHAAGLFERQEVRCDIMGSKIMELKSSPMIWSTRMDRHVRMNGNMHV
jgi:hypothetical protein